MYCLINWGLQVWVWSMEGCFLSGVVKEAHPEFLSRCYNLNVKCISYAHVLNIWSPASRSIWGDSKHFRIKPSYRREGTGSVIESDIWNLVPFSPYSLTVMRQTVLVLHVYTPPMLTTWYKLDSFLKKEAEQRKCPHEIGLGQACGALLWLMIEMEGFSALWTDGLVLSAIWKEDEQGMENKWVSSASPRAQKQESEYDMLKLWGKRNRLPLLYWCFGVFCITETETWLAQ